MNRIDQLLENYRSHIQMPLRPAYLRRSVSGLRYILLRRKEG